MARRFFSGLSKQKREAIRVAADGSPSHLVLQFVIGAEVQIGVADKLEALIQHLLDHQDRIDASSVFAVSRFHVALGVVDDAIKPTGF